MDYTPRSVEGFRMVHGRAPTVAEFHAIMGRSTVQQATPFVNDGRHCGYCYDPECTVCCDEEGNAR